MSAALAFIATTQRTYSLTACFSGPQSLCLWTQQDCRKQFLTSYLLKVQCRASGQKYPSPSIPLKKAYLLILKAVAKESGF